MFEATLFLGIPIDSVLERMLSSTDPQILNIFIQEHDSDYLKKAIYQDTLYIGKSLGKIVDFDQISSVEKNIKSILKRLVPDYCCQQITPLLFTIRTEE